MSVVNTEHVQQMLRRVLKRSTKLTECELELEKLAGIPFHAQERNDYLVYSQGESRTLARFACFSDGAEYTIKQKPYVHAVLYKKVLP